MRAHRPTRLLTGPLFRLLDHLHESSYLCFRPRVQHPLKPIFGKMIPEILNDVERLPPAVYNLEAGLLRFAAQAVAESDRTSQAGAAAD